MKTFKKIICLCLLLTLVLLPFSVFAEEYNRREERSLTEKFFRLHIRANSNSEADQALKLKVRDSVLSLTTELLASVCDKKTAIEITEKNLKLIKTVAEKTVTENGCSYSVNVGIKREFFPYREYDGFYLPTGEYDCLILEIGSGKGENWWCVVFPAVCLSGSGKRPETHLEQVPDKFRLGNKIGEKGVVFKFWFIETFKTLFG